jgi:hypothetical protein
METELPIKTAVVSHDAGGAEILSSYLLHHNLDCLYVLEGPALEIFERKLGFINVTSLEQAVSQSESILCSTSWQSDIEFQAIKLGHEVGKRSVAFLDHWVNYRERFYRSGKIILPNELWVCDVMAEAMAKEIFLSTPVVLVNNHYMQDARNKLESFQSSRSPCSDFINILYICEPISSHALLRHGDKRFWGYVEDDALRYFLANISVFGKPVHQILIRPHPSEPLDKYTWIQHEFNLPIQFAGRRSLLEEISECDVVVGCESMAMVVALEANKKVLSCIPPGGRSCVLPHAEIVYLQNVLKNQGYIYEDNQ